MSHWRVLIELLEGDELVEFGLGLTAAEMHAVEDRFGFRFPPDLAEFLGHALPLGRRFPNWRDGPDDVLQSMLSVPVEGILFDVRVNGFWLSEWGERPKAYDDAASVVRNLVGTAPKLIPVWAHRMIPDRPHLAGNPVFSVHQTDIIHYGCDLRDYLLHEFVCRSESGLWPMPEDSLREIEFWNPERFATRWDNGPVHFDNSEGILP